MNVLRQILVLSLPVFYANSALSQASASHAGISAEMAPDGDRIVVEARGVKPKVPLFFSATAENVIRFDPEEIRGEIKLTIRTVQGRPEVLTFELAGGGEVTEVTGEGLRDWAVRQAGGKRYLDLRPTLKEGVAGSGQLAINVRTRIAKPAIPGSLSLPVLAPGEAVGFASTTTLIPAASVDVRVTKADGMVPLAGDSSPRTEQKFSSTGAGLLEVMLAPRGAALSDAELVGAQLTGWLDEAAGGVAFQLTGEARVSKAGARLFLLSGGAAFGEVIAGDGWHLELKNGQSELVFERGGTFPIKLGFSATLHKSDDWQWINFHMASGTVVPMLLEGLPANVTFDPAASVVPDEKTHRGFLAANNSAWTGWRKSRATGEGALFFTSHEQSDVRVGAGLLRQTSKIDLRVLQGKLRDLKIRLEGPGEILGVEGANVLSWKITPDGRLRTLEVRLSRPLEKDGSLLVRSQSALGNFPVRAEPLRLVPEGAVRHSGYVRIANDGAVRLEMADVSGMMQLAPTQYPGGPAEGGARQVFVYRFPSANYAYRVVANQILAEVGVSQIAVYELGDADRVIKADLELDIREAPLREWSLMIPDDYGVVAVNGSAVADYIAETGAENGQRVLKILFNGAVDGRQLIRLRLEKNQAASAGDWTLPKLSFPGAKSVRGHVGVVAASGFRVIPAGAKQIAEMPLSYFPTQLPGLQQAYRLRAADWSAQLKVEALGQSVQADVFHLYSLKEGVVSGSVLINYFVVGAPANEWRLEVPASIENIDVIGQGVSREWRREGNQIIVPLHQPVLGAATLLVTFEQPMSARGGVIKPGEVRPLGVQGERGFVQVVSPLQVKSRIVKAEGGLLKLEPLELPAEFRLLTSSPSLAVYQYITRPFDLEMNIEWYVPAETVDQLVDFAKLSSHISRDGQVVTDARYFVKTRGRKALRIILPAGAKLWEARADHEVVNARVDGDQTLIPLPPRLNPNEPVEVLLRLGQVAGRAHAPILNSPKALSPTVISEWTLTADPGQLLVPEGGTASLGAPVLTETGFEWISARATGGTIMMLLALAVAGFLLRAQTGWRAPVGFLLGAIVVLSGIQLAVRAAIGRHVNVDQLSYSANVVPAGESVTIQVGNMVAWQAMISWWGILAIGVGMALLAVWALRAWNGARGIWLARFGMMLCGVGVLAQRGGAGVFFLLAAAGVFFFLLLPQLGRWLRRPRAVLQPAAAALWIAALCVGAVHGQDARPAEAMVQSWKVQEGRLFGEIDLRVRGVAGDSFLLLKPPAVLTDFQGDELRVTKVKQGEQAVYYVALERDGAFTAHAKFEAAAGDATKGLPLLTGLAAVQRVQVVFDQGGWEFFSPSAVSVRPLDGLAENQSGAALVLLPVDAPVVNVRAKVRDVATEKAQYFSEAANLFIPGPGVVNAYSRVTIRPVQGQVSELELEVPSGFTVGDVANGPIGDWRFDPVTRRLRIGVAPAQSGSFGFNVEMQRGTDALPVDLALNPLRVLGVAGEVGMIGLASTGDAQAENIHGLSAVNLEDFDAGVMPKNPDGRPIATLQQVFRYGREGGRVTLRVAPVAPEIRAVTRQVLTFGDDRLLLSVDLRVSITRAGLFKLSFAMPEGLDVEAISGAALSQWTEANEGGQRVITLQLNGRTIGEQNFVLTLTGASPATQKSWQVPRLLLREATRQTGEIFIVPEKGVRLQASARENVSQLDPAAAGDARPGVLAFRLLQENWDLKLGVEALEPWVTAQALQEITMREGQTLSRLSLRYRVDNAAVKQLRVRLPGLSKSQSQTVRATGPAVSDLVKVAGADDLWEIHFQRGIVGETEVQIEFQGEAAREQGKEFVRVPILEGVRQLTQFVAIRSSGRLELDAGQLPGGWQRVDWGGVPGFLQDRSDRSVPTLCYRVAEPEAPLAVNIHRHDVAAALNLRVTRAELTTLFSPSGPSLTAAQLTVEVIEKSSLRVRLPKDAQLVSAFVNEESASVVRDGDACLLTVSPNTDADRSAAVRLVYSVPDAQRKTISLVGPSLDVPLENVSWRMIIPAGYDLASYQGSLRLAGEKAVASFGLSDYENLSSLTRKSESKKASALIEQANAFLQNGDQALAGEALSRAANSHTGDEAFNEDARVQLRTLKTQQAVVGLSTRRQRLYLENTSNGSNAAIRNGQLEQAASLNSVMQGKTNFDLQQVDQLLMGNTADENTALRGIAARIVEQQLAAEPAPGAIDVSLPETGKVLTFNRSIQVDGEAPLTMQLRLAETNRADLGAIFALLIAVGIASTAASRRSAN